MRKDSDDGGFTLVELIIVVMLIMILVGISMTAMHSYTIKAARNTDMYNARAMETAISDIIIKRNEFGPVWGTNLSEWGIHDEVIWWWHWTDEVELELTDDFGFGTNVYYLVTHSIAEAVQYTLPASKSKDGFVIVFRLDLEGTPSVEVEALCNPDCKYKVWDNWAELSNPTALNWNGGKSGYGFYWEELPRR